MANWKSGNVTLQETIGESNGASTIESGILEMDVGQWEMGKGKWGISFFHSPGNEE